MQTNNKCREALASILGIADHLQTRFAIPKLANQEISELKQIAETALAAPRLNCEVGTAEEQVLRHHKEFCGAHHGDEVCCAQYDCEYCFSRWAQTPCKEGGEK